MESKNKRGSLLAVAVYVAGGLAFIFLKFFSEVNNINIIDPKMFLIPSIVCFAGAIVKSYGLFRGDAESSGEKGFESEPK